MLANGLANLKKRNISKVTTVILLVIMTVLVLVPSYAYANNLKITKIDQNDDPIQGAVFKVEKLFGSWIEYDTHWTNPQGDYTFGLAPGFVYRLTEVSVPPGYSGHDPSEVLWQQLVWWGSGNYEQTIVNTKLPLSSITVHKTDNQEPANPIEGVGFRFTGDDYDETKATDAKGEVTFSDLRGGTYHLVETSAPECYEITYQGEDIELGYGEVKDVYVTDTLKLGSIGGMVWNDEDQAGDMDAGEAGIVGVLVELFQDDVVVDSTTTDASGNYIFTGVRGGAYMIVETDPDGYDSSTPNEIGVEISCGEDSEGNDFGDYATASPEPEPEPEPTPTPTPTIVTTSNPLDASISKSVDKASAGPGEILTYTIGYANMGKDVLLDVQVADGIPGGTTYVDGSASGGGTLNGSTLLWNIGQLNMGDSGSFTFQVTVNADASGVITNTATIAGRHVDPKNASVQTIIGAALVAAAEAPAPATVAVAGEPAQLPYTGLELIPYILTSLSMAGAGFVIRRRAIR